MFVRTSQQTAVCPTQYSLNGCHNQEPSVYCVVRTGFLRKMTCCP